MLQPSLLEILDQPLAVVEHYHDFFSIMFGYFKGIIATSSKLLLINVSHVDHINNYLSYLGVSYILIIHLKKLSG